MNRSSIIPIARSSRVYLSLTVLLSASIWLAGCGAPATPKTEGSHSHQAAANPTPRIPAFFGNLEQAKPLPEVLNPKQFDDPVVAKAYGFAKENPDIFAQQPCYCYCDSGSGHRSLLDCYATDHSAG